MTSKNSHPIVRWLHRRAENFAVVLIALMFVSFMLQIFFRYFLNNPLGWTEEVTVLCWLWTILWGAAFVLSDSEEIRFDIVYGAVRPGARRVFTIASSIVIIVLLLISLPASWDYVAFMKRERTAYLRIPLDYLYSIYVIFIIACIVRHGLMTWKAIRNKDDVDAAPGQDVASHHVQ